MVPLALFHILVGKSSGEREPANGGHGGQTNGDSGWRGLDDEMEMMEIKSAKNISSFLVSIFRALYGDTLRKNGQVRHVYAVHPSVWWPRRVEPP